MSFPELRVRCLYLLADQQTMQYCLAKIMAGVRGKHAADKLYNLDFNIL